jgi:hypothetical protein
MVNKLTLNVDAEVVAAAKAYAKANGTSVSQLVEDYLKRLTSPTDLDSTDLSPWLKSVVGSLELPADFDEEQAKQDYLLKKYG